MGTVRVEVSCDTSQVDHDLNRIGRGPDTAAHLRFDQVLTGQFQTTQAVIHVWTGSLRASGHHEGSARPGGGWKGEIVYGGATLRTAPDPGPARNPGQYAVYEFRKPFDAEYNHDWVDAAYLVHRSTEFADVVTAWMRGEV
jgi:hypothetical protein